MKKILLLLFVIFLLDFGLAQTNKANHLKTSNLTYIKAGKLFDSSKGCFLNNQVIVIKGKRILEVGRNFEIPKGANIIDLSDKTVLPGLIESHFHMLYLEKLDGDLTEGGLNALAIEGDALRVLRGAARAKTFLNSGYTTVLDVGNSGQFLDIALQKAINEGTVEGPRMIVTGPILCSEGGQMKGLQHNFKDIVDKEYRIVNGIEDAISAVRENVNQDVDLIKICSNNSPNNTSLTIEEINAIVKTAHRYNKKVIAHATNDKAAWEAVMAGVDRIEHGRGISDSTFQLMAKKGVALVPTPVSEQIFNLYIDKMGVSPKRKEAMLTRIKRKQINLINSAAKSGVKIISGSDNYKDCNMPQGDAAKHSLIAFFESGMTPSEILTSATYTASEFLGALNQIGIIKKGNLADIIAVEGDLKTNFRETLFNVKFVMKDGKVFKK